MVSSTLFSSASVQWFTPADVVAVVAAFGLILLDPCGHRDAHVDAELVLTERGLDVQWNVPGLVFVNPPYGRGIGTWIDKCRDSAGDKTEVIALVPARTDTKWFHRSSFDAVCFWKGRIRFGGDNPAPFPSAFLYWGHRPQQFCEHFSHHGVVMNRSTI